MNSIRDSSFLMGIFSDPGRRSWALFCVALIVALAWKMLILPVGSPFVTIDDHTAFEGGFLVWFGQSPPQRMHIESWVYGVVSLLVFSYRAIAGAVEIGYLPDIVASAYADFYANPAPYVGSYRFVMLLVDAATAVFVFLSARLALGSCWRGSAAVIAGVLYAFTPSTFWMVPVARPDTLLAFFCSLGFYLYLRSNNGSNRGFLLTSAVSIGFAAGVKLHGALLAIFLCADLIRVNGLRSGLRSAIPLAVVSAAVFAVAAGSVLFDPAVYLKIRMANYIDDQSPWIHWGDQFIVAFREGGYILFPATILVAVYLAATRRLELSCAQSSTLFVAALWLLLFISIRQLRAYWMLPGLVVLYPAVVVIWARLGSTRLAAVAILAAGALNLFASMQQTHAYRATPFDAYTHWARDNLSNEVFYVWGHNSLFLPRNTSYLETMRAGLMEMIDEARREEPSFVRRHARSWEERARLQLIDMLDTHFESDFEYYDYYNAPPEFFASRIGLDTMQTYVVQRGFDLDSIPRLRQRLEEEFDFVTTVTGAGGGASGLPYDIYRRKQ